jgi:hypothetical protein
MKYLIALSALCLMALYFNGVYAEEECLGRGYSAEQCAKLK